MSRKYQNGTKAMLRKLRQMVMRLESVTANLCDRLNDLPQQGGAKEGKEYLAEAVKLLQLMEKIYQFIQLLNRDVAPERRIPVNEEIIRKYLNDKHRQQTEGDRGGQV